MQMAKIVFGAEQYAAHAPFITAKIFILNMEKPHVMTLYLSLEFLPEAFPDDQWLCSDMPT